MRNPVDRLTEGLPRPWRVTIDWLVTIVGAILIVLAIKAWVVNPYRIPSSSMEPTLHCATPGPGCEARFSDRVLANRFIYHFTSPKRGDIVVFNTPPEAAVKCGAGGVFVKTEGVNPGTQAEIFYGLLKPSTLCENVYVGDDGDFDFYNFQRTSNGRAVVRRADFMHASNSIDVEHVDNFVLITRGPLIPAISRLTREQAAALMVLGQAMESSAGNPALAGTIRSEFFYDPFVAGDRAAHANRFYEIQKCLPEMNYYLLNTSGIGSVMRNGGDPDEPADSRYRNIRLEDTMAILDSLLRGGLENWVESPSGFLVPGSVRAVDDIYFHPEKLFSATEFEENQATLNRVRREAIEKVGPGLDRAIRTVFDVQS